MSHLHSNKAPSLFWTLAEGRAIFEFNSFYALRPLKRFLPKGDGHPVLVLPGFMATDSSTRPLRRLLDDIGYRSYPWGLGRNKVFNEKRETEMGELLKGIYDNSGGRKVSIVGWSLGGAFARELLKIFPQYIRCVITLGSPISGNKNHSNAHHLFERINGKPSAQEQDRFDNMRHSPPVPCTSIFSKTDGIVAWVGSLQFDSPTTENIRVPASHLGLGFNPIVMYAIADRLSQDADKWQKFDLNDARKLFFRQTILA